MVKRPTQPVINTSPSARLPAATMVSANQVSGGISATQPTPVTATVNRGRKKLTTPASTTDAQISTPPTRSGVKKTSMTAVTAAIPTATTPPATRSAPPATVRSRPGGGGASGAAPAAADG